MPTDTYRSNFFAVKDSCLLVSISSSPFCPFAHEMLIMLDNQCCHLHLRHDDVCACLCPWQMIAVRLLIVRKSMYIPRLTFIFRGSPSLGGTAHLNSNNATEDGIAVRNICNPIEGIPIPSRSHMHDLHPPTVGWTYIVNKFTIRTMNVFIRTHKRLSSKIISTQPQS